MKRTSNSIVDQLFSTFYQIFNRVPTWTCLPIAAGSVAMLYYVGVSKDLPPVLQRWFTILEFGFGFLILIAGLKAELWKRRQRKLATQSVD